MADYDIGEAFERIQDELLSSMMRNMAHHRKLEEAEGLKYEQWQAQQLQALNEYIQNNPQRFAGTYRKMNSKINDAIRAAYKQGRMDEEIRILQAIKKGYRIQRPSASMQSEFFTINERALNALLDEVNTSVENVQTAILRRANDEYRKAQFNAQVYFGSGAGTLGQAVDMAVHDMLARGLSCVQYKNGRIVGAADYARMALRTARTRAYLQGEASMRDEWGINTVVVKSRSLACPKCIQWVGRVYYDDQWGHIPVKDNKYPRLSEAIKGGLYHPNCKDIHSTYFEGISEPPKPPSEAEIKESVRQYRKEQRNQYIQRNIDKYRRLEKGSVEPENKSKYGALRKQWTERKNSFNAVDNYGESGIIKSRAISGALNPESKKASEHAIRYYNAVRKMTNDAYRIALNTGYSVEEIQQIKNFIFIEKHDLGRGKLEYFDANYEMAQSWQRLIDGKNIQPHDLTLLKHEIMERELVNLGLTQSDAHIVVSKKYNYSKESMEYYDKIKKYKKE